MVSAVQQFLRLLHSRKKQIILCWTPSHVGVTGNEIADREAKMATSFFRSCSRYLPDAIRQGCLPSTYYYPALRQGLRSCWQECWTSNQWGAKLSNIKPNIG